MASRSAGSSAHARIPILMLSARDTVPDRILGLESGADDYLTKPFELAELAARLRALLRRSERASAPDERSRTPTSCWTRDGTRSRARRGRSTLTPTEYRLLEYFMRNPEIRHGRDAVTLQRLGLRERRLELARCARRPPAREARGGRRLTRCSRPCARSATSSGSRLRVTSISPHAPLQPAVRGPDRACSAHRLLADPSPPLRLVDDSLTVRADRIIAESEPNSTAPSDPARSVACSTRSPLPASTSSCSTRTGRRSRSPATCRRQLPIATQARHARASVGLRDAPHVERRARARPLSDTLPGGGRLLVARSLHPTDADARPHPHPADRRRHRLR